MSGSLDILDAMMRRAIGANTGTGTFAIEKKDGVKMESQKEVSS